MALHTLDIAVFRATFPEFADDTKYPDPTIQIYWDLGTGYIGANDGCLFAGVPLQSALNFMCAHLLKLFTIINAGGAVGQVTESTIDKVSVTLEPPPGGTPFKWWLGLTPYGQALLALLNVNSAGGFYFGGRPEQRAFRKVGGRF